MSQETTQTDLFGDQIDATVKEVLEHIDGLEAEDIKLIYSARLAEFYDLHSHVLEQQAGITGEKNHKIAAALVAAIGNYFGGVSFYLPHNEKMNKHMRNIRIYKAFDGTNVAELSKRFNVSQQTVYNAIAQQRDLRQKKLPF